MNVPSLTLHTVLLAAALSLGSCAHSSTERFPSSEAPVYRIQSTTLSPSAYAKMRMKNAGISKKFITQVERRYKKSSLDDRNQIRYLNILGFLKRADYSAHYNHHAIHKIRVFTKKYSRSLKLAEKKYGVDRSILSALLWVETRHGSYIGDQNIALVYYSMIQSDHPEVFALTLKEVHDRKPASQDSEKNSDSRYHEYTPEELKAKVIERSVKKSEWALEQLQYMDKLYQKGMVNILKTKGSFAGAFGNAQFLPKTYFYHAVSDTKKRPNLFRMRDAILSVANYLHHSGWKANDPKAQSDALFEYNRIRDYGDVIQRLAKVSKKR